MEFLFFIFQSKMEIMVVVFLSVDLCFWVTYIPV